MDQWQADAIGRRTPANPDLFINTAPQWNCVDDPEKGPHYINPLTGQCLWCGDVIALQPPF